MLMKKERVIHNILLMVAAMFMAVSFFVICDVNSDGAGTYVWLRGHYELGGIHHSLREYLDPWFLVAVILYRLGIGKTGTAMVACCYSVWIFLCSFLALKIALKRSVGEEKDNGWLLFLAVFIMMPAVANRYHLPTIFAGLVMLWAIDKFVSDHNRASIVLAIVYVLYTIFFSSDKMLGLMEIIAPVGLYAVIWCIQKRERHKFLLGGFACMAFILACVRIVSDACSYSITDTWGGYGGASYMYWTDMHTFFDKGIPSFFAALLGQYNISIKGGFVQFLSFYWIIRIVIVGIMLAVFIFRCRDIVVKGIENVYIVDSLSVLTVATLVGINILNGIVKAYPVEASPINRYAGLAWYLLVIILIRWVNEHYVSYDIMTIKSKDISSGFVMGMIFIFLIVGYSQPIYRGRDNLTSESCQPQLDFLEERGDKYQYGLASYWKTNPVTAISNGKYVLCTGWVTEDEVEHDKLYLNSTSNLYEYEDGSNYFNFIISDKDNFMTMDEENIEALRGDYTDKIVIGNTIYWLYDYDIRWNVRLIMEAVGTDYELLDSIKYYFDFPVGTNRIEMEVTNSGNLELSIEDNEDVKDVSVHKISDNKVYVDLVCTQNTNVTFHVSRRADEMTTIHKIVLKRVRAAIEAKSEEIYLKPGNYIITFGGNNLHDLQTSFEGENITVDRLTDGRIKNRYLVNTDKAQTIRYNVAGKNVVVDKVYYENAVLFEDEQ